MPALHDLFFSHRTAQAAAARPLLDALAHAGLIVWRDESGTDRGDSISDAARTALSSSRALLAWYSPDYDDSPVCRWELRGAWVSAEAVGKPTDRVSIVLPPGFTDPRRVLPSRALRAEHDALCFHAPADPSDVAAWDVLAARIAARIHCLDNRCFGELRALDARPRWVPHRRESSNRFVGRRGELWELHGALQASRHVAVTGVDRSQTAQVRGLGGVGKTLLATEYAVLFERAWPGGVYWFDAAGRAPTDIFAELGGRIGLVAASGKADETEALVRAHFQRVTDAYLWILDDIPVELKQADVAARSAPSAAGHTLITTRSRTLGALGRHLDLGVLSDSEALELLTRRRTPSGDDEAAAARALCARLGNHPLAVDVLGALLSEWGGAEPYQRWLERLDREDNDALALGEELAEELPTGVSRNVAAVLWRSLEQLGPEGWDVLRVAACLAPAPIPDALIAAALAGDGEATAGEDVLGRGRSQLLRHSLAEVFEGAVLVHALVARAVRFGDRDRDRLAEREGGATKAVSGALDGVGDILRHGEITEVLVHARFLVRGDFPMAVGRVATQVAGYEYLRGQFREAAQLLRRLVHLRAGSLGLEHPDTLNTKQNLAVALMAQGGFAEAHALNERVLEARARLLGPDHPDTLTATNNLAGTSFEQGDFARARALYERALDGRTGQLGPEHADTLAAMHNLAFALMAQGDLAGARAMFERARAAQTHLLGAEHPATLLTTKGLATTLREQGDLTGARALQELVLQAQVRYLGPDHPEVLGTAQNLANTLFDQGDYAGARTLHQRSLVALMRNLGPAHPETLKTTENLAATLGAQGDLAGARVLGEHVLEARARLLGPDHPETLTTTQNLAGTLKAQGDLAGARALEERALEARTRLLGREHPGTRVIRFNLVLTLLRLDPPAAIPHVRALQAVRRQSPDTLAATDRQILADLPDLEADLGLTDP